MSNQIHASQNMKNQIYISAHTLSTDDQSNDMIPTSYEHMNYLSKCQEILIDGQHQIIPANYDIPVNQVPAWNLTYDEMPQNFDLYSENQISHSS